MTIHRIMDKLADVDTRFKVLACFFIFSILPAGLSVFFLNLFSSRQILPFAGLYLVMLIVIQFPVCSLCSNLMVLRNVSKINDYCQKVKRGLYNAAFDLPPEKGEENDFLRAKRNLYWMGRIIASRERKLVDALDELNIAQLKVMESIEYASRIQHTLLPPRQMMDSAFPDHFVWWEPRNVVGGDSYWMTPCQNGYFFAAIDCTGHGVPGAFMTLIVHALLEHCMRPEFSGNPARVLEHMNRRLKAFLHRNGGPDQIDDGFDAAVCHIGPVHHQMVFAGAGLPLYYESGGTIVEIKGDRHGVGDSRVRPDARYTNHTVDLTKASKFYMATDGVTDQIGGPKRLPFGKKRFKRVLGRIHERSFAKQKKELSSTWRAYAGDEEKRDDLTVLGFSLPPCSRREYAD